MMEYKEIWEIIAALIHREECTADEQARFRQWREELGHEEIYDRLRKFYQENAFAGSVDVEKAWRKNRYKRKHMRRPAVLRWMGYAALLLLTVGSGLYLLSRQEKQVEVAIRILQPTIRPGSPKAILTLTTGEKVDLQEHRQPIREKAGIIRNENNLLAYSSQPPQEEEKLEYNILDIPRGGEYQLRLEDGTRVWINADTRLRYPVAFGKNERRIYLEGEAYFEVQKDATRPFIVCVGRVEVLALGTQFNVSSFGHKVFATLVEGAVKIDAGRVQSRVLKPAEQAIVMEGTEDIEVKQVNTALYTSWKDGYYAFEQQSLREIMQTLARWYDIEVFFGDEEVSRLRFSGRLKRYEDISNFLSMIRLTNDVSFEMKGKSIIVKSKINRK